jgi:hypothetical protein
VRPRVDTSPNVSHNTPRRLRSSALPARTTPVTSIRDSAVNPTRVKNRGSGQTYRFPTRVTRTPISAPVVGIATPGSSTPNKHRDIQSFVFAPVISTPMPFGSPVNAAVPTITTPGSATPATPADCPTITFATVPSTPATIGTPVNAVMPPITTPYSATPATSHHTSRTRSIIQTAVIHRHNTRTSSRRSTTSLSSAISTPHTTPPATIVHAGTSETPPIPDPNSRRYCYCDFPSDVSCQHCLAGACSIHAYAQCSGQCGRWFHPECAGWKVHRDAHGDPPHIVPGWDAPAGMSISLSTATQGDSGTPCWCIKCYGARTHEPQPITNPEWLRPAFSERVLRIGLLPPDGLSHATIVKKAASGVAAIRSYAGEHLISKQMSNLRNRSLAPSPCLKRCVNTIRNMVGFWTHRFSCSTSRFANVVATQHQSILIQMSRLWKNVIHNSASTTFASNTSVLFGALVWMSVVENNTTTSWDTHTRIGLPRIMDLLYHGHNNPIVKFAPNVAMISRMVCTQFFNDAVASLKLVWTLTMVIYTHHSRRYILQGGYHYLPPMVAYTNYQQLVKHVYLIMCLVKFGLLMQRDASLFVFFCILKHKVELLVSQSSWIRPSAKPIPSSRAYSSLFVMVL